MGTFAATYVIVWLAIGLYVFRLGAVQRRLDQDIEQLERRIEEAESVDEFHSRAA